MKKLRAALRAKFGARQYRITRRGEVHAYGMLPNSAIIGWFFFGYVEDMPHWLDGWDAADAQ